MSNSNDQQQPPGPRSTAPADADTRVRAGSQDDNSISQQPPHAAQGRPAQVTTASIYQDDWEAARQRFEAGAGRPRPPVTYVQMNQLAIGRQDLTALYGSGQYPSLDYAYSFATANRPHLPPEVRRVMERMPATARPLAGPPYPPEFRTPPLIPPSPLQQPPPVTRRSSEAAPPPSPPTVQHPTAANTDQPPRTAQGPDQAPPSTSAQLPIAAHTSQPPSRPTPATSTTRVPGETPQEAVQRQHGINVDDRSSYADGTAPIAQDVQDLATHINAIRRNGMGFPMRTALKELKEHFMQVNGKLKSDSVLWRWYGDTRLFTRPIWYYLVIEGKGQQVPP